jgi:hypothetical protein
LSSILLKKKKIGNLKYLLTQARKNKEPIEYERIFSMLSIACAMRDNFFKRRRYSDTEAAEGIRQNLSRRGGMWLMPKITVKLDLKNVRTDRICPKVTSASGHLLKKPCIYEF